ncbi:leukocyte antigen CD37 [Clarias gariepinus]|uniref:leukocyte antigen CD37 n=1 Tax=Clarias gariepinus TaxID=13013 RepID=UPI00234C4556|nr:leukocyte antigen CD37 [Clarias gariepinus]XP_053366746.1 leukocyte antigen CD37 [Clarias gariepinus]
MASECCLSVTKYFLFLFNLIFFFLGLSLLGLGVWIICSDTSSILPDIPYLPLSLFSYLLIISGSVTMLLGFFGSFGALKEVKCMLAIYFILLTVLLAAHIIGTVLLFTQRSTFENSLDNRVQNIIESFNVSSLPQFLQPLQFLQSKAQCCGWGGQKDWETFLCSDHGKSCFYKNDTAKATVNATGNATTESSKTCRCNTPNCVKHEKDCKGIVKEWLNDHLKIILAVVLAVAVVEICGIILSMCLYNRVSMDYAIHFY